METDFRHITLNGFSDFDEYILHRNQFFLEMTQLLNARMDAMHDGSVLLVTECTSLPANYPFVVKWFIWRSFLSHNAMPGENKKKKVVYYDMLPDNSGIKKVCSKLR